MGGDHLDRMMDISGEKTSTPKAKRMHYSESTASCAVGIGSEKHDDTAEMQRREQKHIDDIVGRSTEILQRCQRLIYFINMKSLFQRIESVRSLKDDSYLFPEAQNGCVNRRAHLISTVILLCDFVVDFAF